MHACSKVKGILSAQAGGNLGSGQPEQKHSFSFLPGLNLQRNVSGYW